MPMQQTEWAEVVARLNLSYPRQQVTRATADLWYAELQRFDAHLLTAVLRDHLKYSSFAPSCAELYTGALALAADTPTQAAIEARGPGRGVPMPAHVKRRLEELGLRRVGKAVPGDDRVGPAFGASQVTAMAAPAELDPKGTVPAR